MEASKFFFVHQNIAALYNMKITFNQEVNIGRQLEIEFYLQPLRIVFSWQ